MQLSNQILIDQMGIEEDELTNPSTNFLLDTHDDLLPPPPTIPSVTVDGVSDLDI